MVSVDIGKSLVSNSLMFALLRPAAVQRGDLTRLGAESGPSGGPEERGGAGGCGPQPGGTGPGQGGAGGTADGFGEGERCAVRGAGRLKVGVTSTSTSTSTSDPVLLTPVPAGLTGRLWRAACSTCSSNSLAWRPAGSSWRRTTTIYEFAARRRRVSEPTTASASCY